MIKKFERAWTKKEWCKSILFFLLHFIIFIGIAAAVLLYDKFSNIRGYMKDHGADYLYALFSIFLIVAIMYFYFLFEDKDMISNGKNISLLFIVLDVYFLFAWFIGGQGGNQDGRLYARPVALVSLLIYVLVGRKDAIFMTVVSCLLMFIVDTFTGTETLTSIATDSEKIIQGVKDYYSSLLISFSAGMFSIFICSQTKTRFSVVLIGMFIVIPIDLIIFLLEISKLADPASLGTKSVLLDILTKMGHGFFGGVMSTVIFLAILPIFEGIFNRLTVFRLRELTSTDAKILKKLKEEAPGTYNHSTMVAQLSEACAAAIGENADYARAAALYHDVGKLHNPEHFTENQSGYNLHDELSPELSADIIRSHAKDGYTLIRNQHLPEFLADVALQHHGTMPIRYFYAKALKLTDAELNIEDFSYLGPKPQTKIAAIVMIADASEAAVRAANARTPEAAQKAIQSVIEERMNLEQFSECDITLGDLTKITHALVNTLTGVYHHRIKYPNLKYRRTESGTKGENE